MLVSWWLTLRHSPLFGMGCSLYPLAVLFLSQSAASKAGIGVRDRGTETELTHFVFVSQVHRDGDVFGIVSVPGAGVASEQVDEAVVVPIDAGGL